MIIIVAVKSGDDAIIAGDKLGVDGLDKVNRKDPKVFIAHGIKYGFTSSFRMGQILQYHSEDCGEKELSKSDPMLYLVAYLIPMWRRILRDNGFSRNESGEDLGGVFIVSLHGRIFKIDCDFQVAESQDDYTATGCGESYALGCLKNNAHLEPMERVKQAIETACYFSAGCGGGMDFV